MELSSGVFYTMYIPWLMTVEGTSYNRAKELCDKLYFDNKGELFNDLDDLRSWIKENKHGKNY